MSVEWSDEMSDSREVGNTVKGAEAGVQMFRARTERYRPRDRPEESLNFGWNTVESGS